MESLILRNTWVSFLNVSLKKHTDVIAGREINQTYNEIFSDFMNKYVNPPCNSSLATSCAKSVMGSSYSEGIVAAPFTEGLSSSGKGELAIDETAQEVISRSARLSRRLLPLARSASASIDFPGHDHSRTLLEQAFGDGM